MSLATVADAFELRPIEVQKAISELHTAGIALEIKTDSMSVRPKALRDVLHRQVFSRAIPAV